ncbi:MAG: hypothetical protein AB1758_24075, partial [Candidatus Eremiobacterota bacterium]
MKYTPMGPQVLSSAFVPSAADASGVSLLAFGVPQMPSFQAPADTVTVSPTEAPSGGISPLLSGLAGNYGPQAEASMLGAQNAATAGASERVEILRDASSAQLNQTQAIQDPPQSADRVDAASPANLDLKSLGHRPDVSGTGSGRGLESGPTYGPESVEMPGQVEGTSGSQFELRKDRPDEARSILARELGQQELARGTSQGQADRTGAAEDGLRSRQDRMGDARGQHQRELQQDSLTLNSAQTRLQDDRGQVDTVGQYERELAGESSRGQ